MLYQDVRPTDLDDVVGSQAAVASIRRAIQQPDQRVHCYLLSGPSGCGKTTLARLAAKEFGCDVEMDLEEINAASNRGIDMARELEKKATSRPFSGGARAVIIDEGHMLTKEAQNALLKILEDTPDWLYYFICSTEPNRLLKTIHTRSQRIEVESVLPDQMFDLLANVIEENKLPDPGDAVLDAIATNSAGSPRQALVMLEGVLEMSEDEALLAVQSYEQSEKQVIDVCRAIAEGRWDIACRAYRQLQSPEPENVRRAILGYLHAILVKSDKDAKKAGTLAARIEELESHCFDSGAAGLLMKIYNACSV
jgi:DNA polymerase III gamma/tau subunit